MKLLRTILLGTLLAPVACDREEPAPPPATQAVLHPVETPATKPTKQPMSIFVIEREQRAEEYVFAPARMVINQKDGQARITLFSKDPEEARRGDFQGNSFWFEATLDVPELDALPGAQYAWRNSVGERTDTNTGLFLEGGRRHLQPLDAALRIERDGETWVAYLAGTFLEFNDLDRSPPATVNVSAELLPEVIVK